jgi:hypothetical protein
MIHIDRYDESMKGVWDDFVSSSKNGVFLFCRDYMGYHADRFPDHSLLCFRDNALVALLPATLHDDALSSHAGLTFGGFVVGGGMTTPLMLSVFDALVDYLRASKMSRLLYKCVPHIYHALPAEEDRYALFVKGARLYRRDVTSTIDLSRPLAYQERRRRGLKKAQAEGIAVRRTDNFEGFWVILEENLRQAHGVKPVHSLAEIRRLQQLFPEAIKLFCAYRAQEILAGVVLYENARVAHAQYIGSSEGGRRVGALEAVFHHLLCDACKGFRYFDYGVSTEDAGRILNQGLIDFKEGFGARAIAHDFYELGVTK